MALNNIVSGSRSSTVSLVPPKLSILCGRVFLNFFMPPNCFPSSLLYQWVNAGWVPLFRSILGFKRGFGPNHLCDGRYSTTPFPIKRCSTAYFLDGVAVPIWHMLQRPNTVQPCSWWRCSCGIRVLRCYFILAHLLALCQFSLSN